MDVYPEVYSHERFWKKLRRFARKAGRELVERALVLYCCLKDSDTPAWARGVILGALGYFVVPLDAVPDVVPFTGLADDFGILVAALATVSHHIKPEHRARARSRLPHWFARGTSARTDAAA